MPLFFEKKEKMRVVDEAFGIDLRNRVLYVLRTAALIFFLVLAVFFFLAIQEVFHG